MGVAKVEGEFAGEIGLTDGHREWGGFHPAIADLAFECDIGEVTFFKHDVCDGEIDIGVIDIDVHGENVHIEIKSGPGLFRFVFIMRKDRLQFGNTQ